MFNKPASEAGLLKQNLTLNCSFNHDQICKSHCYEQGHTLLWELSLAMLYAEHIDIERCKNRLLKFCYVPATSAAHNTLLFYFFAAAVYSTNEENMCR